MTASVPEETKRIFSIQGTMALIFRARASSRRLGAPKVSPSFMDSVTAARMSGWAWPRISGPQDMQRSRKRWPSSSSNQAPLAFLKNLGVPPTARKARTGLETPPGKWVRASWKRVSLLTRSSLSPRPRGRRR